ncbi:6-phospho-3-hexuloisomerase [Microbacterium sp.]|uniref:6-phospho-3-hexuloisomerase n=1 Tax=Microbacterium sp. TaxID=51671 RepID=UPI003C73151D
MPQSSPSTTAPDTTAPDTAASVQNALRIIRDELTATLNAIDADAAEHAMSLIGSAPRVFTLGQGRSGIALRGLAMRLTHLGRTAHVVGDTTSPSVQASDVLVVASGSGTTETIVRAATKAAGLGVKVVAFTSAPESPLAAIASAVVPIRAATKTDHSAAASEQYAGGLFEQSVLLLSDAIFHTLWKRSGATAEQLWTRHANLE